MNTFQKLLLVTRLKHSFYHWDRAALESHQLQRVIHLLSFARQYSKYYAGILPASSRLSLSMVPTISKAEYMEQFDRINTAGLIREKLIDFAIRREKAGTLDLFEGSFSVGLSSGTSGNKSLTVLSHKERDLYMCALLARNGLPSHIRSRRVMFALRTNNPAFMAVNSRAVSLIYVDYTHPIAYLIALINEQRLNILAGPPSLLKMLSRNRTLIKQPIEALVSYAEVLDEDAKSDLEKCFQVPVVQIYQGAEGFIGSTCRAGKLHLNEDIIQVELQDIGDALGNAKNIVVTDLYRTTAPIIRYQLNDVLEISPNPCECGSCFRVIERIHGRADDIFVLAGRDGTRKYLFPDYMRRSINQASNAIVEYQAIQHALNSIEIRLILTNEADRPAIERAVLQNLSQRVEKINGILGEVIFTDTQPELNERSKKLIRVKRAFHDETC